MELRSVHYFQVICEEGSFRAAADKLGVAQPTLSKAIGRLEDETGALLFDRSRRGVSLTVYGRSFLRHAKAVAASTADVRNEIEALRRGTTGTVSVGVGPSWITQGLAEAIRRLRAEHPGVHLKILRGHGRIWKFWGEGKVDGKIVAEAEFSAMIVMPGDKARGGA